MDSIYTIQNGDKVTGRYCGVEYVGTVREQRQHTMNHRIRQFSVQLDAPQTILGMERDSLLIAASDDFSALIQAVRSVARSCSSAHSFA